jgi:hypothetical protein
VGTPLTFELKKGGRYTARGEVGRRPEAENLFDRINRIIRIQEKRVKGSRLTA